MGGFYPDLLNVFWKACLEVILVRLLEVCIHPLSWDRGGGQAKYSSDQIS